MGLAWTIVGILVPLLVGVGLTFTLGTSMNSPEFLFAKGCFVLSAIMLGGMTTIWVIGSPPALAIRIVASALAGLLLLVALPEALRWVTYRQTLIASPAKAATERAAPAAQTSLPVRLPAKLPAEARQPKLHARVRVESFYLEASADGDQFAKLEVKNRGPGVSDTPKYHSANIITERELTTAELEKLWSEFAPQALSFPPPVSGQAQLEEGETIYSSDGSSLRISKKDYETFVANPRSVLYVFAVLTYSDVNTRKGYHWVSEFCAFKVSGSQSQMTLCGIHNRIYNVKSK